MTNEALKKLINSDKARNKENRRAKLYLNLLRREKFMGGKVKININDSSAFI